jgi:5'(3')-deoxyribonucleotidase
MNIYIDFDDTITSSIENVVRIINKRYNRNVQAQDICQWDFSDVYPDIPLKTIVNVFGEEEFFKTLKLKNDVIPTLRRYAKYNNLINFSLF